jgi:hypothetical protein
MTKHAKGIHRLGDARDIEKLSDGLHPDGDRLYGSWLFRTRDNWMGLGSLIGQGVHKSVAMAMADVAAMIAKDLGVCSADNKMDIQNTRTALGRMSALGSTSSTRSTESISHLRTYFTGSTRGWRTRANCTAPSGQFRRS